MGWAEAIQAIVQTGGTAAQIIHSKRQGEREREFAKQMYNKQRSDSLQDTADLRAYQEQMYNKYESPLAKKNQYKDLGYSPLVAIGQSGNFTPSSIVPNSDTSSLTNATTNSSINETQQINNSLESLKNSPLAYFQAQNLMEDARSKRLDNDYKELQNNNNNSLLSLSCSKDDFPQLYGYNQSYFENLKSRLGRVPTFRDLMSLAIVRQPLLDNNSTEGHNHDWKNGKTLDTFNAWSEDNEDILHNRLLDSFLAELETTLTHRDILTIQKDFENYKKDNGFWDAEKKRWTVEGIKNDTDAEWYVVEKWLNAISSGTSSLTSVFNSVNVGQILTKLFSKSKPNSFTNYK